MSDIFEQLAAPFDPSEVDWRVGPTNRDKSEGQPLCYIDARTVMDRLDTVCGPAGWQNRYVMEGSKTVCEIGILCGDTWVWKADGAGDSDIEAEKGALSDAFKRAAVRWGVGRYLYDLKAPWVPLKAKGNSYVIAAEARPQLDALLRGNKPKADAPPKPDRSAAAKSYVDEAIKAIGTLTDAASLNAWVEANKTKLERLRDVYDEGSRQVSGAILETRKALMRGAAE
jgi:hypothetical protein